MDQNSELTDRHDHLVIRGFLCPEIPGRFRTEQSLMPMLGTVAMTSLTEVNLYRKGADSGVHIS